MTFIEIILFIIQNGIINNNIDTQMCNFIPLNYYK